ncbi:MAG: hypothetical protein H7Z43_03480 [Clostridia bacterium]|nr:hypothetical protein [Deltaproteobacteria bacterium]
MRDAPNHQVDALVSGLVVIAAARLLRVGFLHGTALSSFSLASVLPVLTTYLLGFALLVTAFYILGMPKPSWATLLWAKLSRYERLAAHVLRYSALAGLAVIVGKAIIVRAGLETFGSDGMLFTQYGTDLVLTGRNPYAVSMIEAYQRYHVSQDLATFRIDGSLVTALSYPAMSVLTYIPQAALHIPNLDLTTLIFFGVSFTLIIWSSPWSCAWIPLVLLSANSDLIAFSGGGVFDAIWLLPMLFAMFAAARQKVFVSGLLFGWACSAKQTPWLAAPFLIVFFVMERKSIVDGLRFAGGAALSFFAINAPFIVANPAAWFVGSLTPVAGGAPLVERGTGPILLNLAGITALPKEFFSVLGLMVLASCVVAYAAYYTRIRWLAWAAPVLALWCNYRSLQNYFVFYIPITYLGVLLQMREQPIIRRPFGRIAASWAIVSAIAVIVIGFKQRDATALAGNVQVSEAIDEDRLGASSRLIVDVRNDEPRPVSPVFALLHKTRVAPMIWRRVDGPQEISAHQISRFTIEAPEGFNGLVPFESGMHIRVYERGTEKRWSSVVEDFSRFDAHPLEHLLGNPKFTNWTQHGDRRVPYGWRDASFRGRDDVTVGLKENQDGVAIRIQNRATRPRKALALAGLEQPLRSGVNAITVDATTMGLTPCVALAKELPEFAVGFEMRVRSGQRIRTFLSSCSSIQIGGSKNDVRIFIPAQADTRKTYDVYFADLVKPELFSAFTRENHPFIVVFAGVRPGNVAREAAVIFHSIIGRYGALQSR